MGVNNKRWTRTTLGLVLTASLLAGCGGVDTTNKAAGGASTAPADSNAKPFKGKNLSVYMGSNSTADYLRTLLPEFEEKTGMKVEFQVFANEQLSQKLSVQLTTASATPDVFTIRPLEETKLFEKNGWVEPLEAYITKDPAYGADDFSKSSLVSATSNNHLTGIPMLTEQQILYYRKDLLKQANIEVPKTMDELKTAVQKLHNPDKGIYGFVARGQKGALVTQLSSFVFSEGGDFQSGDKATLNTPQFIKAATIYVDLLKNYGPPGVLNMGWPQAMGVFSQGKAAFLTDTSAIFQNAVDPEKSTVADKIGFAPFPAGSAGSKPFNITAWALSMNAKSNNKDAAWAFIQWVTSKEMVMKLQLKGTPGARDSVWKDPKGEAGFPQGYIPVIIESTKNGVGHDRPEVIKVGEARDVVSDIIIKGLVGEDIKAAADKANQDFQTIIDKEKGK
jgi:multiple sugar transport system substrate-binding protein